MTASATTTRTQPTAEQAQRVLDRRRRRRQILAYILLIVLAVFFLFPIAFMFVGSFKDDTAVLSDSGSLAAFLPTLARTNFDVPFSELALPPELLGAVIAHRGKLTPDYRYIEAHLAAANRG